MSIIVVSPEEGPTMWKTVWSSEVKALDSAPIFLSRAWNCSPEYFSVPRNIMCSKKWAKPLCPASISSREPVRTTL
jgi:hypothetical protein